MQYLLLVAALAQLSVSAPTESNVDAVYKRVPPMSFDCAELPDICTSMCWGAYCTEPAFGATLSYDAPTDTTKSARRTSAGCQPRPNRCSVNHNPPFGQTGWNCDEYPFASTSDADQGGQTNRCVPKEQNSSQGGIINGYISSSCGCAACQFIVGFGNPAAANVKYCDAFNDRPNICVPDDNTYKGQNPDVQPAAKLKRSDGSAVEERAVGGMYMTKRGHTVSFAADLAPGTKIKRAVAYKPNVLKRVAKEIKGVVVGKRQDCDTGDGDEWDNEPDAKMLKEKRMSSPEGPDYEFLDDEIDYKL